MDTTESYATVTNVLCRLV